jgi:predicted transcriptional regulator
MIVPCEMATKAIVPTIRAMVAKELSQSYKLKQSDIASLLGITQSAVSQYLGNIRGRALNVEGVKEVEIIVKDLASILKMKSSNQRHICHKCCEACRIIRERRILCQLHGQIDPLFNNTNCDVCIPTSLTCI